MGSSNLAYFLALLAAVFFSGASVIFARFSLSHSSLWMNIVKSFVAGITFCLASLLSVIFFQERLSLGWYSVGFFLLSGALGLAVGDYYLFRAYERIGSARTIMIFSFSPLFLAFEGFLFFGQKLTAYQGLALLMMMGCAWVLSLEKFRSHGVWEWHGILYAMIGVALDNVGVVLSRFAFDASPGTSAFTANAIRCFGALVPLLVWQKARGQEGLGSFFQLRGKERSLAVGASFIGTFLSLSCWLTAVKIGHIGGLAGVGSFNPVAASLWEWALLRKRPTRYLLAAFALFLVGFLLLLKGGA